MMRQVREVLGLRTAGVGLNEIARRVGVAPSTVRLTLQRLTTAGLSWPLPAEMTDTALETALFAAAGTKQGHRRHVEPDWTEIHRELKRKHVTLTTSSAAPKGIAICASASCTAVGRRDCR
jgi:DNA-binding IclR family transcriptional regulator